MNKSKIIPKLLVLSTLAIIIFSFLPATLAVSPQDRVDAMLFSEQNISDAAFMGWDIESSEESYFILGIGYSEEDKDNDLVQPPYKVQLLVDGQDIKLRRFSWNDKEGYIMEMYGYGPIPVHWWFFYHVFEPGYFEVGLHNGICYLSARDGQGSARIIWEFPMEFAFNVI
ncbi:MAG: hypothetical protein WBH31_17165 [Promethearchaeia archaeon]